MIIVIMIIFKGLSTGLITHADVVNKGVSRVFSGSVHMCVSVYVCQQSKTKSTVRIITKHCSWIVHDKSWSPISFEVKRLNVKVTGSNKCNVETVAAMTNKHSPEGAARNVILQSHNIYIYLWSKGQMSRSA